MKKHILVLSLLLFAVISKAQENDAYKSFIQVTSATISKAQKEMIHAQKTEGGGLLAKAIILQNHAIALYKENKNNQAVCASAAARKYATQLIKNIIQNVNESYLIHTDEQSLLINCATDDVLYNESISFANNPSENDKDYINSLNNLIIDFN